MHVRPVVVKPTRRPARPPVVLGVLAAFACGSLACGSDVDPPDSAGRTPLRLVDATGTEVVLPGPARRVVSLVPSATETLRAIGADSVLVGRTDFDTQAWAADIPSVGGGIGPNLEAIVALQPDLVVRFAGEQDPRTPARLDALSIPHVAVRPDRIEDIYRAAHLLGRATGHAAEADSLVARMREGLARASRATEGLPHLRVAYVLGGSPPWVSGPGTFIDEVIQLVGGENAFDDLSALYTAVSPEEILSRDIDVVLLPRGADFDPSLTPAARVERVGPGLEIPGPDVVDATFEVAEVLYGRDLR